MKSLQIFAVALGGVCTVVGVGFLCYWRGRNNQFLEDMGAISASMRKVDLLSEELRRMHGELDQGRIAEMNLVRLPSLRSIPGGKPS
jgi:hypothetical protein